MNKVLEMLYNFMGKIFYGFIFVLRFVYTLFVIISINITKVLWEESIVL